MINILRYPCLQIYWLWWYYNQEKRFIESNHKHEFLPRFKMNLSDVFTFMLVLICLHNAIFQDDKNISITLYVSEMGNLVVNSFKLHTLDIQICLVISINLLCGMQFQTNPWKLINYSFYSIRVVWKIHLYGWSIFLLSIDLMIMKNIQRWIFRLQYDRFLFM